MRREGSTRRLFLSCRINAKELSQVLHGLPASRVSHPRTHGVYVILYEGANQVLMLSLPAEQKTSRLESNRQFPRNIKTIQS